MFKKALKKNLIAGLLVTIPAALTYMILSFVITRVDRSMKPVVIGVLGPQNIKLMEEWHIPGMGFVFLVLFIIAVGLVGTNFIGKKIVAMGEKLLHKIPVVRVIYTSIKKVVDTVSLTETPSFQKMVLITYPREPLKTLGIVCCDTPKGITEGEKMLNVFVPTSPNPTTGFLFMLPEKDTQPLKMSVEEGLKMIISFGMTNPESLQEYPPGKN
ncbi:MAG: DUF502 domain-containing protein [Nitrospinota bacterium]|nr:DUF502 domain-containing protein [Nitrospinota bacterium]MED5353934.1 DUF502 domain-containing protein [Nitrospinota bacterium]MEE3253879.1 DUF502 domain-containing protein [Nitrospinota bacterium]